MRLRSWLNGLRPGPISRRVKGARRCGRPPARAAGKMLVEQLESRVVPAFMAPASYSAGSTPYAVVTADFNNDAQPDLAVANYGSDTVSFLQGNADGTFQAALDSDTGTGPLSLAVGDFNGDGNADLATANLYDVSVLLGNGDGTFAAPVNYGAWAYPQSVAVGDFNADGTLDLGVTSNYFVSYYYGGYYVSYANVLVGNGDGTFSGPNVSWLGYGFHSGAAAADFNADGITDFASANFDYWTVSVLAGDAGGYLLGPVDYSAGYYPYSVTAGDVNGDGAADLVTANLYGSGVSVLLGSGDGDFAAPQNYATDAYPAAVILGDLNHDSVVDIATANQYSNDVSVVLGLGDGTFSRATNSPVGSYPSGIAVGDFNGDGWLDAATANQGGDVSVLINDHAWPPADAPSVSINNVTVTEGNTDTTAATFTISLSAAYDQAITVHYATADGSAVSDDDYSSASGDITFAPGETSKTITIDVLGDRIGEDRETFAVNLTTGDAFIGDGSGTGTILDDEPRISIGDAQVNEGNTGSVNASFTVSLSAAYDVAVTVHYETADGSATAGSDYTAASGDVTFAPGETSKSVAVAVTGDRAAENTEDFFVNLSAPSAGLIIDDQGAGTIFDNEPRISINNPSRKEGNGKSATLIFTVSLSNAYDQAVTVNFATADGSATVADHDYQARSGTLTFAPGETTKTISIVIYGDSKNEPDEWFAIDLSGASSNSLLVDPQGIGWLLNDDGHGKKK